MNQPADARIPTDQGETIHMVTSKDGSAISYLKNGNGPGLVILHGAMESIQSHIQLARNLAKDFTVYLPDRRGRGLSGPYRPNHCIQNDVDDIEVLLLQTDAHYILGVSSGALISLQAALTLSVICKAAIFEPPLPVNDSIQMDFVSRYDREIAQGNLVAALVTGMLGAQMGPPIFNSIPRWLLRMLTSLGMKTEDKNSKKDDVTMRKLAPTLHYDFRLVMEMSDKQETFRAMPADILLLGGSESPRYLKVALDALQNVLPRVQRVDFPGLGHGATGNKNRGGKPELVAEELRRFFL